MVERKSDSKQPGGGAAQVKMNIIETYDLTKIYNGKIRAVDGVSFSVKEGEIFGFLGPNGAGKTTTIKMLITLNKPTSGTAKLAEYDVIKNQDEIRNLIGIVFQDPALDDVLTGRENLDFHARMYGMKSDERKKRIKAVLDLVKLEDRADSLVKTYSGGMRRRLEIARGLMHFPKILFLDEPTLGLDPQTRRSIWDYIKEINSEQKMTIFLTTHYMEEADYLCNRVAIIDKGKIIVLGKPSDLKEKIGNDVVNIKCTNLGRCEDRLRKEKWIKSVKRTNEGILIGAKEIERKLPVIIKRAEQEGLVIQSIDIRKPTLEDVFLYYTGKTIREEEAGAKDKLKSVGFGRGGR